MPTHSIFTILEVGGNILNPVESRRANRAVDDYVNIDQLITSGASATIGFAGVTNAYTVFLHMGNSGSVSLDGQLVNLNTNGYLLLYRTSMAAISINNGAASATNRVRVSILGS